MSEWGGFPVYLIVIYPILFIKKQKNELPTVASVLPSSTIITQKNKNI